MNMAGLITTQRNFVGLLRQVQSLLPEFFGFEGVGIMFRDMKTGNMFTISAKLDEQELAAEEEYYERKRNKQVTTKHD